MPDTGAFLLRKNGNSISRCEAVALSFFCIWRRMSEMLSTWTTLPCAWSTSMKRLMWVPLNSAADGQRLHLAFDSGRGGHYYRGHGFTVALHLLCPGELVVLPAGAGGRNFPGRHLQCGELSRPAARRPSGQIG